MSDVGYRSHPLERGIPPRWASEWGEDEYGVFVGFAIEDVEHRFRWIPAGTFTMGSPEREPGRDDDEGPQHTVTLTTGFWLGDAPCTQALYEAVVRSNPSRFQSPDRPVEGVSWEDAQAFIGKLNGMVEGLDAKLPTEAQWEYACRADTTTSTYAGELVIKGDNNASLLDEIAWYGGNSGVDFDLDDGEDSSGWPETQHAHERAGTRIVKLKKANPWGLCDMLGNVYEWCEDRGPDFGRLERYIAKPRVDPAGPKAGEYRVIRGGSWYSGARRCRAAYRHAYPPDDRYRNLGFRLFRGP